MARLARSSPATVSYVINNGPKFVSEGTRKRILEAIEELRYRPDPVARSFRSSDSHAIGMLVPNFRGPFFADLVAEVERQAVARGKVVLFGSTDFDPDIENELLSTFRGRRVGAILVLGPTPHIDAPAMEHGAVNVLRQESAGEVFSIGIPQRAATRAAARHLLDHGRTRTAAIFGPSSHGVFNVRYRGWRDATSYDAERTKQLVRRAEYSFQGGYDAAMELFSRKNPPDSVLMSNDTQAIGALSALHRLGLKVPEDVAVVSIDATELSPFLIPALTSVRQPTDLIAQAALDIAEGILPEKNKVRVPFSLELRESCGCSG